MTNADVILEVLRSSSRPLDDDQLSARSGIVPRQQVNQICRRLEAEGDIVRSFGPDGKIVNSVNAKPAGKCLCGCGAETKRSYRPGHDARHAGQVGRLLAAGTSLSPEQRSQLLATLPSEALRQKALRMSPGRAGAVEAFTVVTTGSQNDIPASVDDAVAGSSHEQRAAEAVMLDLLGRQLGEVLQPRRLRHASGAFIEVDGVTDDLGILVECWAHQGPAKVAQKYKLVNDATKLAWIAKSLRPAPDHLILCVSDERAVAHLRGRSWQGAAIKELGVEIAVVALPPDVVESIVRAQARQFR